MAYEEDTVFPYAGRSWRRKSGPYCIEIFSRHDNIEAKLSELKTPIKYYPTSNPHELNNVLLLYSPVPRTWLLTTMWKTICLSR